jgi:hypothetical protein
MFLFSLLPTGVPQCDMEPSRDELVRIFAKRFPSLSLQQVGERFDEYLRLGHLDFRRDELTGEWQVLLSGRNKRQ